MSLPLSPPPAVAALRALADRVAVAVAPAERLSGADTWIGPAADRAIERVAFATYRAGEAAVRLRATAAQIEAAWRAEVAAEQAAARAGQPS